ncbi:MAG: prepilin-type N-terminal cleavage/methylation domain-containing protein [Pseudomonadota bacterium]
MRGLQCRIPSLRRRRGRAERGFSLVEAVVALSISALTLALLSGAAFSLRAVGERNETASQAVDLLAARRVIRRFASETVLRGAGDTAGFMGGPSEMRLLLAPDLGTGAPARLAVLRIERSETQYQLAAYRQAGAASVLSELGRTLSERSVVLESEGPIGFAYLVDNPESRGTIWVSERQAGPPPHALAVRLTGGLQLTAPFHQELDPGCLALYGLAPLARNRCVAR